MDNKVSRLSLNSRTVKQKLIVAFQLMSILPFLVCVYLLSIYIFPRVGLKPEILMYLGVSVFLAVVGFLVIKEVFDRLAAVANEAKIIAAGDIGRKLKVAQSDEVGELSHILNHLTHRIRNNMEELKNYSEKTTQINLEIQKKIIVLSNLMQISGLISEGAKFEETVKIAVEKSRALANSEIAFLLFQEEGQEGLIFKVCDGASAFDLSGFRLAPQDGAYQKIFGCNKLLILDAGNKPEEAGADFAARLAFKNCLAMPIAIKGQLKAVLGIANNQEEFAYKQDDLELLDIFSKQIAVAIENDILAHRVEKLEIKDNLTGLYNRFFIENRLQEEIKRAIAYQRPCALVIFDLDNFQAYRQRFGAIFAEAALKKVAKLMLDAISEVDRAGRTGDDEFSLILPEKNKRQAQSVAEEICGKIESAFCHDQDKFKCLTLSAGVSENPLDGVGAEQLTAKAGELLKKAKSSGKNRVVVF